MAGTDQTFHLTKEDIRKAQSKESNVHGGNVPAGSEAAALQSIIDQADKSKPQIIDERKANLPLPEQPQVAPDSNSADARTVNVGSGAQPTGNFSHGDDALRGPATGPSAVRIDAEANGTNVLGQVVGREGKDGLEGLPDDAVARGAKGQAGLANTTGNDCGYPGKNDPSSGVQ